MECDRYVYHTAFHRRIVRVLMIILVFVNVTPEEPHEKVKLILVYLRGFKGVMIPALMNVVDVEHGIPGMVEDEIHHEARDATVPIIEPFPSSSSLLKKKFSKPCREPVHGGCTYSLSNAGEFSSRSHLLFEHPALSYHVWVNIIELPCHRIVMNPKIHSWLMLEKVITQISYDFHRIHRI